MVLIRDRAILAMMGGQTLIWAALFYSFVALVPSWQADFGWSTPRIMAALSVAAIVWAAVTPWAGRLIDRGHGPVILPLGALIGAGLLIALSQADSYAGFVILWMLIGVCMAGTLYEPAFAMILRARGEAARGAITAIAIVAGFASTLAYPLAQGVEAGLGWRWAVGVMAVVAGGLAAPLLALSARWLEAETPAAAQAAAGRPSWRAPFGLPHFPALAAAFALVALLTGAMLAHLFPLMADRGVPEGMALLAASLIGPAQVAGRVIVTLAAPKLGAGRIVAAAMLMLALSAALMATSAAAPVLIFAFVLAYGTGNGLVGIFRPVLARERYGRENIGAIAGALAAPALLVGAVAPVIGAALAAWGGGYGVMLSVIGVAGLGAALLVLRTEP